MTTTSKQLEVVEDQSPQKWCISLREDVFGRFLSQHGGSSMVHKVFGDGSLFSPMLFGKFFDPSDAFPLWEFESNTLLSNLRSSEKSIVDWFQTDQDYVLKAELPGLGKGSVQACIGKGAILEISGQWKQQPKESRSIDWRSGHWWEDGYVRRLELPENVDLKNIEVNIKNDIFLEIRILKNNHSDCDSRPQASDMTTM